MSFVYKIELIEFISVNRIPVIFLRKFAFSTLVIFKIHFVHYIDVLSNNMDDFVGTKCTSLYIYRSILCAQLYEIVYYLFKFPI